VTPATESAEVAEHGRKGRPMDFFEDRIADFVDRERELRRFQAMFDSSDRPVLMVRGPSGQGKTSLRARMSDECRRRALPVAHVEWANRPLDPMTIMRLIRSAFGEARFPPRPPVTKERPPGALSVSVADGARLEDSIVDVMAGIYLKDSHLAIGRSDSAHERGEELAMASGVFFAELAAVFADQPAVVFLDGLERATPETRAWVVGELIHATAARRLAAVRVVLFGRDTLELERVVRQRIDEMELAPLERTHVVEYLRRRGLETTDAPLVAEVLVNATAGVPLQIAIHVDRLLNSRQGASGESDPR
jgi:hypothetical protein